MGNGARFRRAAGRARRLRARRRADRPGARRRGGPAGRREPPRVLGLVVEVVTRRRIFVPMLRVTDDRPRRGHARHRLGQPAPVRAAPQRDARRRRAARRAGAAAPTPAVERASSSTPRWSTTRARDWVVGRLAVRERRGRLARRGQAQIVAWDAVDGLALTDRQGTEGLLAVLETMRPADVASTLTELPRQAPPRGGRRARRRAAGRRLRGDVRVRPARAAGAPRRRPRRRRAGGDGPRRRRRPARASCPPPTPSGCSR